MRTLAVAALLACAALPALRGAAAAGPPEGDLVLDAMLEQKSVKLGEDAVVVVTLVNRSSSAVKAPSLRLARDSISLRVSRPGAADAVVTRLYGSFLEDVGGLGFRPAATPRRDIAAGDSLSGRVTLPAVLAGELTVTAVLADGTPGRIEAKPVILEVQPKTGAPRRVAAQVDTTRGTFTIDLDAMAAYGSVANFWTLAREGFFDGLAFHRVLPGVLAQTGDPSSRGTGGSGWYVPGETAARTASRGDVGVARGAHADSGGSQWFVVADGRGTLDAGYVRFGTVSEGLDVLDKLVTPENDPKTGKPRPPDRVIAVRTIVR